MSKRREHAYHLTGVIALLASLIGAYVSLSELFSWSVLKDTLGSLDTLVLEVAIMFFLLLGVFISVSYALFSKDSVDGKEAKSKQ